MNPRVCSLKNAIISRVLPLRKQGGVMDILERFYWPCLDRATFSSAHVFLKRESSMYGALNEVYLQKKFRDGCNFCDESNDDN